MFGITVDSQADHASHARNQAKNNDIEIVFEIAIKICKSYRFVVISRTYGIVQ